MHGVVGARELQAGAGKASTARGRDVGTGRRGTCPPPVLAANTDPNTELTGGVGGYTQCKPTIFFLIKTNDTHIIISGSM